MSKSISQEIETWITSKSEQMISDPIKGYYSADIVIDAFKAGEDNSKNKMLEQLKLELHNRSQSAVKYMSDCIMDLQSNNYAIEELYISFDWKEFNSILLINEDDHLSDEFIDKIYPMVSKLEIEFKKMNDISLNISFVDDSKNLNRKKLLSEGFSGFNFKTGEKIN